jgi:hypothetical protein
LRSNERRKELGKNEENQGVVVVIAVGCYVQLEYASRHTACALWHTVSFDTIHIGGIE